MRYGWQRGMAVAMNRASTTHLRMLTHKHTLTHVNTCTRKRGLTGRVWTRPAVHMGTCLTAVTDSWNGAEEKTHINTRRLRRGWNTHPDMSSAQCARLLKNTNALTQKCTTARTVCALLLRHVSDTRLINPTGGEFKFFTSFHISQTFLWLHTCAVWVKQYGQFNDIRQIRTWTIWDVWGWGQYRY